MLTIRPGITSCLAVSKLCCTILFCQLLDYCLEAFLCPRDCICPGISKHEKCQLGAMQDLLGAAKLKHKTDNCNLTSYTEQEQRERTSVVVAMSDRSSLADMQILVGASELTCKVY